MIDESKHDLPLGMLARQSPVPMSSFEVTIFFHLQICGCDAWIARVPSPTNLIHILAHAYTNVPC